MSAGEVCLQGSPGPASSANNPMKLQALVQNDLPAPTGDEEGEQISQDVVKIPSRIIFNLMLDKLSLPRAQYRLYPNTRHKVHSKVVFYASTHVPGEVLQRIEMQGAVCMDPELAEESAALEGIRHMESLENMVIEDLNFSELKYVQEENKKLRAKLEMEEKYNLQLGKGLIQSLDAMLAAAHKINDHINDNCTAGQEEADKQKNTMLELFGDVAFKLYLANVRGYKCI